MNPSPRRLAAILPIVLFAPTTESFACSLLPIVRQSADDQAILRDYLSGNGLLNRGMFDLAAKEYRKFLDTHPEHEKAPVARYGLSVALFRMGSLEDAEGELATLADADDFEFAAEVGLLLGQCRLARGDFAAAADALAGVVNGHRDHDQADDAAVLLAEALYRDGKHDAVIETARSIASSWNDAPLRERSEFFAGLSELALDRPADAAKRFASIVGSPSPGALAPRAALLLARSLEQNEDLDAAAAQYRRVIDAGHAEFAPDAMYSLAAILRREEKPEEAAALLDRLFVQHPASAVIPAARLERGRAHFAMGEFNDAFDAFEQASEDDESLADSAAYWMAKCELRGGDFNAASNRLQAAIEEHPKSDLLPEMRYDRAIALLRGGDAAGAIAALAEFRREHPKHDLSPDALHLLAAAEHQRAEYDRSIAFCREFAGQYETHALSPSVAFLAAENFYLKGDLKDAAPMYEAFLASYADDSHATDARYRLGSAYFRLDQPDKARPHLEAVVAGAETAEPFRSALLDLGDIHFASSEWSLAADRFGQYLETAGEDAPNADDALLKMGLSFHRQDKYEEALNAYGRVISGHETSPHRAQALFERGQALVATERFEEAAAAFRTLVEDDNAARFLPHALGHLGAIAMRAKEYEQAAGYYERLASIDAPAEMKAESRFQRGQALMAMERYRDAAPVFASLAADHPRHERAPAAKANEALCLARDGRHADALQAIARAERDSLDRLDDALACSLIYEKAWCLRETKDDAGAIETYRAMLADDIEGELDLFARVELAEMESGAGRHAEAADLLRGIVGETDLPADLHERAQYRFAACLYELDQNEAAAAGFDAFLASHVDSQFAPSAHLLAGEALFRLNRQGPAAEHLDKVLAASPDGRLRGPALLRLGEARASLQDWKRSEAAFSAYLEDFGDSEVWFQARFGLGFALENQLKYDDAIRAYREVADRHQGATAARSQFQIGECLFAQKKHDEAVRELLKVDILYAYPEWSAAALYEAGRCFEAMAQLGQARAHFEMVRQRHADTRWAQMAGERLAALARTDLPGRDGGD